MTGAEFAALRASKGVSQRELAEHAGVSIRTVWSWEHMDPIPPKLEARAKRALKRAAEALHGADRFRGDYETRLDDMSSAALVAEAQQILGILAARLAEVEDRRQLPDVS